MTDTKSSVRTLLIVEARVPEGFSACADEHRWHRNPTIGIPAGADVSKATAAQVWEHADVLLAACPNRRDYEYRVVMEAVETTTWIVARRGAAGS